MMDLGKRFGLLAFFILMLMTPLFWASMLCFGLIGLVWNDLIGGPNLAHPVLSIACFMIGGTILTVLYAVKKGS